MYCCCVSVVVVVVVVHIDVYCWFHMHMEQVRLVCQPVIVVAPVVVLLLSDTKLSDTRASADRVVLGLHDV